MCNNHNECHKIRKNHSCFCVFDYAMYLKIKHGNNQNGICYGLSQSFISDLVVKDN